MSEQMFTVWGEQFRREQPLQEYPRPQLVRESYFNLNGVWKYAVRKETDSQILHEGEIVVPFSPEAPLSGCDFQLQKDEVLHYECKFTFPRGFAKEDIILHFGAVDQVCIVSVDGKEVCHHGGGYLPFSCSIAGVLSQLEGEHVLSVDVRDFTDESIYAYGKQKVKRGGIWYTQQSGIWQTVWMESVPKNYIQSIRITPDVLGKKVKIQVRADNPNNAIVFVGAGGNKAIAKGATNAAGNVEIQIEKENFHLWTPEDPYLYQLEIGLGKDKVYSYFGFRSFGQINDKGTMMPTLNGKPYFQTGILDQGYWADGLYTAPSDEALKFDIQTAKDLGFNMLRKHIKIEPLRWYYHCDQIGMLIWQDIPSGGNPFNAFFTQIFPFLGGNIKDVPSKKLGRENLEARRQFEKDLVETLDLLYNCVSLCTWVPFNEGWGQFDAERIALKIKEKDDTRLVDHASGWYDQRAGNFKSLHIYYKPLSMHRDKNRILALTEFGGYTWPIEEHRSSEKTFGYRVFQNQEKYEQALERLYKGVLHNKQRKGLAVSIYTQLTDVEDEQNGLLTYDRKVIKVDQEKMQEWNQQLKKYGN